MVQCNNIGSSTGTSAGNNSKWQPGELCAFTVERPTELIDGEDGEEATWEWEQGEGLVITIATDAGAEVLRCQPGDLTLHPLAATAPVGSSASNNNSNGAPAGPETPSSSSSSLVASWRRSSARASMSAAAFAAAATANAATPTASASAEPPRRYGVRVRGLLQPGLMLLHPRPSQFEAALTVAGSNHTTEQVELGIKLVPL